MKGNMEERAERLALYILENRTTVRAAAQKFGISKSSVHTAHHIGVDLHGCLISSVVPDFQAIQPMAEMPSAFCFYLLGSNTLHIENS